MASDRDREFFDILKTNMFLQLNEKVKQFN